MLVTSGLLALFTNPTFTGSVSNLSTTVTAASLDDQQTALLASAKTEFLKTSAQTETPGIASIVNQLPEAIRPAAITELVTADLERREIDLGRDTYWAEFKKPVDPNLNLSPAERSQERAIGKQLQQVISQSGKLPLLTSRQIFLFIGFLAIPVVIYSLYMLGKKFVRLLVWALLASLYKIRITGAEKFPTEGSAVAVANHSSWLDGALLLVLVPRIPRTIAWAGNFSGKVLERFANFCGVILMGSGPKSIKRGLTEAREVCRTDLDLSRLL